MSENEKIWDVIIVGAGAAGMMAAAVCADQGLDVAVVERNSAPGKKICITGKGRCNVTNNCDPETVLKNTVRGGKFLFSAVDGFSPADAMDFFEQHGVMLKTERGNRVFPVSDRAEDVRDALHRGMTQAGANLVTGRVKSVGTSDRGALWATLENGQRLHGHAVLIATGGMSYPGTGSTGDGYRLARDLGHTVVTPEPSLVSLTAADADIPLLQGLSLKNVTLKLWEAEKKKPTYAELGEMLFTHYGVSGPLVLSASAYIRSGKSYKISIDLKPGLDAQKLDDRILRDFDGHKNSDFSNSLDQLLPKKMIPVIISRSGIEPRTKVNNITKQQRRALCELIKNFEVHISGKRPLSEAVITRGGVSLKEIDPKTMASKIVKGLYFAGEVMDLDGFTGGFNLQIAYATAVAAGRAIVAALR